MFGDKVGPSLDGVGDGGPADLVESRLKLRGRGNGAVLAAGVDVGRDG